MYRPVQDGIAKTAASVRYAEVPPPADLAHVVHCIWELRTLETLPDDFHYHALPDACVNLLLNQLDVRIAGITALRTSATTLNLGQRFHYVGVQLFPGVWQKGPDKLADSYVGAPYEGALPLVAANQRAASLDFAEKVPVLADLVVWCVAHRHVVANPVTARILQRLDDIGSVADMAHVAGLSARQLQRTLKRSTGFSPHDLLKVLRLQQSFRTHHLDLYADQSHFIHAFRNATGYTPLRYRTKFRV